MDHSRFVGGEQFPDNFVPIKQVAAPPAARYGKEAFVALCHLVGDGIDAADAEPKVRDECIQSIGQHLNPDDLEQVRLWTNRLFTLPQRIPVVHERRPDLTLPEYSRLCMQNSVRSARLNVGSQIGQPFEFYAPGGRFDVPLPERGRSYGWDRWPTYRGAVTMGREGVTMLRKALYNASYTIEILNGNDPNGTASYFQFRAHPNVMHRMVALLAEHEGPQVLDEFLEPMEKHYLWRREGADDPDKLGLEPGSTYRRLIRMPNGKIMYRFYDDGPDNGHGPRDEMYLVDLEIIAKYEKSMGRPLTQQEANRVFTNIRATAEHGEDFSADLCADGVNLYTLNTIDRASVKLNGLQYQNARLLAQAYRIRATCSKGDEAQICLALAAQRDQEADDLAECLELYNLTDDNWCSDYDIVERRTMPGTALNGVFALASGAFRPKIAIPMLEEMDRRFSRPAGLVNTLHKDSLFQWDNLVWGIMQLEAVDAAVLYGRYDLALKWATTWLNNNDAMYQNHGCLHENNHPDNVGEPGNHHGKIGEYPGVKDLIMTHGADMALRAMLPWLAEMASQQAGPRSSELSITIPQNHNTTDTSALLQ